MAYDNVLNGYRVLREYTFIILNIYRQLHHYMEQIFNLNPGVSSKTIISSTFLFFLILYNTCLLMNLGLALPIPTIIFSL